MSEIHVRDEYPGIVWGRQKAPRVARPSDRLRTERTGRDVLMSEPIEEENRMVIPGAAYLSSKHPFPLIASRNGVLWTPEDNVNGTVVSVEPKPADLFLLYAPGDEVRSTPGPMVHERTLRICHNSSEDPHDV